MLLAGIAGVTAFVAAQAAKDRIKARQASIGIIGSVDGPTAIFVTERTKGWGGRALTWHRQSHNRRR